MLRNAEREAVKDRKLVSDIEATKVHVSVMTSVLRADCDQCIKQNMHVLSQEP